MLISRRTLAGVLLGSMGCATGAGPTSPSLLVSSTASRYVLPVPIQIVASNRGDQPLYLNLCYAMQQQLADGSWKDIEPIGVCSRSLYRYLLQPGASDTSEAYAISTPGTYRVGIPFAADSMFTKETESFSNDFSVVQ